jgi:hypothetical protein
MLPETGPHGGAGCERQPDSLGLAERQALEDRDRGPHQHGLAVRCDDRQIRRVFDDCTATPRLDTERAGLARRQLEAQRRRVGTPPARRWQRLLQKVLFRPDTGQPFHLEQQPARPGVRQAVDERSVGSRRRERNLDWQLFLQPGDDAGDRGLEPMARWWRSGGRRRLVVLRAFLQALVVRRSGLTQSDSVLTLCGRRTSRTADSTAACEREIRSSCQPDACAPAHGGKPSGKEQENSERSGTRSEQLANHACQNTTEILRTLKISAPFTPLSNLTAIGASLWCKAIHRFRLS